MQIKLKKSLPDYPAGTVFEIDQIAGQWKYVNKLIHLDSDLSHWLFDHQHYPDWFERIYETPLYWEPEEDECFYFIHMDGRVSWSKFETGDLWYREAVEIGNAFPTKESAQAHVEYLKALTRVRAFIDGYELRDYNGESTETLYEIVYLHGSENFTAFTNMKTQAATMLPLFRNKEDAETVINNCQDDLKTIFGVES